jgi:S-adenosylmethionine:diacylglycerol 3-amino-3-carboxypropyl transferase
MVFFKRDELFQFQRCSQFGKVSKTDNFLPASHEFAAPVSRDLTRRDRSAIYGGFHLYVFGG